MGNVSLIDGHIDEPKFTDNEIKKALKCCSKDDCDNCPNDFGNCYANLAGYALDLINRLEAENRKLKAQVHRLKQYDEERDIALHARLIATAKIEAAKEFAEMLKEQATQKFDWNEYVEVEEINNVAKEMEKKYNDNRADN